MCATEDEGQGRRTRSERYYPCASILSVVFACAFYSSVGLYELAEQLTLQKGQAAQWRIPCDLTERECGTYQPRRGIARTLGLLVLHSNVL